MREGAQRLIAEALQAEFAEQRDEHGHSAVIRNGLQPRRELLTGLRPVAVRVPKTRSRTAEPAVFRSTLVPPYVRRAKSMEAALPWLYLHDVSTGDMREALAVLVGPDAKGLSAPAIARLKQRWTQEYQAWRRKSLGKQRWVYVWGDLLSIFSAGEKLVKSVFRQENRYEEAVHGNADHRLLEGGAGWGAGQGVVP